MKLIQPILIILLLSSLIVYFSYFRSILIDRLIALALFVLGIFAIIFPDTTTILANKLGVDRGTDLIFYVFALTTIFCIILLYSKITKSTRIQTEIVREIAIKNASNKHF
jgi:small membrane protein